jgi:fatty acid desaturase
MATTDDLSWDEAYNALVPLMRADNRTNLGYLLREYVVLIGVLAVCATALAAWSTGRVATPAFVPLAACGVALVAVMQHRLSGLAHDASHYTLFKNKLANELVSDLFLMFPLVAMTQKYRAAHFGHHQYVNDPERDADLVRLNRPVPHRFPISKSRFWLRYVVRGLWPPAILRYLFGRARAANLGETTGPPLRAVYRTRVARCLRGAYWLTVLTLVHAAGAWPLFGLFWVVPLLTVYPLLMQLREIAHHSNAPDDGDLTNSRVFRVNPALNYCVFPFGQAFHLTHHLVAMVPHYRLAEAHAILSRHRPYREQVVVCRGYFFRRLGTDGPSVLDLLARPSAPSPSVLRGMTRPLRGRRIAPRS